MPDSQDYLRGWTDALTAVRVAASEAARNAADFDGAVPEWSYIYEMVWGLVPARESSGTDV